MRPRLPLVIAPLLLALALPAAAQPRAATAFADDPVVQAREALRRKDRAGLAAARAAAQQARHPLTQWAEYWELNLRLSEAQPAEVDAFTTRWAGTYVEDRLRNDWLLELGRRRDWTNFRREQPRFRMNDDREVACYALLVQQQDGAGGPALREKARAAWWAQRELDDGCQLMASTLFEAQVLKADDAWQEARLSVEANRPRAAKAAATLVAPALAETLALAIDQPARYLARKGAGEGRHGHEILLLALMRAAANEPEFAAAQLAAERASPLPMALAATAWAHVAKQAALKQMPQAADWARQAWKTWDAAHKPGQQPPWSDDLLAWHARAALRAPAADARRWPLLQRVVEAMPAAEQAEATWAYWKARALAATAPAGAEGDGARAASQALLEGAATQPGFYGLLAQEALGRPLVLPPAPAALTPAEREAARAQPGFARALQLVALGLRHEGVREWNYTLRGLGERELLAAAQWACEREVWDRCINTSERTRAEIDMAQRYPTPWRETIAERAREGGVDAAVVFGLIRQESRFVADIRSAVGAAGLMQLMPATAKWTAKKIGRAGFSPDQVTDPATNVQLGTAYLKRVLDDFGGSLPMAAAAYNAGPGRPRKWREGPLLEPAAWAESIPFNETRDYVKKLLANSVYYAALLAPATQPALTLRQRLGPAVGPREAGATSPDRELP